MLRSGGGVGKCVGGGAVWGRCEEGAREMWGEVYGVWGSVLGVWGEV